MLCERAAASAVLTRGWLRLPTRAAPTRRKCARRAVSFRPFDLPHVLPGLITATHDTTHLQDAVISLIWYDLKTIISCASPSVKTRRRRAWPSCLFSGNGLRGTSFGCLQLRIALRPFLEPKLPNKNHN